MESLDVKFTGVIHKVKDGSFVPPDEWMVFLIKDAALVPMLEFYRDHCVTREDQTNDPSRQAQYKAIDRCIDRVKIWQAAHPERVKVPDVLPGERLQG